MQLKHIAAAISLALGLAHGAPALAAGKKPAPAASHPRAAKPDDGEDMLARTVFQALVGEMALQNGDIKLSLDAWADLAQRTRDPKVLARAIEVASLARDFDQALALTKIWIEVDPDSTQAQQVQASLLALTNRLDDLAPQLTRLLEKDKANLAANLLQINRLLARQHDKKAAQALVDRITEPYLDLPEGHFARAQAANAAGDSQRALDETRRALQLRPDWEVAAIARAQLQAKTSPADAIDGLRNFVDLYPNSRNARLMLARLLIGEKRFGESRKQFEYLLKDNPDSPEIIYPVAMLALQQGDRDTGRSLLEKLLTMNIPNKSTIHYFLGQLDQEEKKPDAALEQFRQVVDGDQYIAARAREAQILLNAGKLDEAIKTLHDAHGGTEEERSRLVLAESQLLREAGRNEQAYEVVEKALKAHPDDLDLLYEAALNADRIGKPEVLEAHLKHLLDLKPDHAQALNALGYSLADRDTRLPEARKLIAKALALSPEDPFILDSMGWVLYRQGELAASVKTLKHAYEIKTDPEIAAHLGEVLWAMNLKDEAKKILNEAARQFPDDEVLAGVIKKLLP